MANKNPKVIPVQVLWISKQFLYTLLFKYMIKRIIHGKIRITCRIIQRCSMWYGFCHVLFSMHAIRLWTHMVLHPVDTQSETLAGHIQAFLKLFMKSLNLICWVCADWYFSLRKHDLFISFNWLSVAVSSLRWVLYVLSYFQLVFFYALCLSN